MDSFGHAKLAGAGKYVRKRLEGFMKNDPDVAKFMKDTGMFVAGVFEKPEIREVTPGHLVRSGHSYAYDVNFGMSAGAAGVALLASGVKGVTVVKAAGREIQYQATAEVIKQRHVDLAEVSLYEKLGMCFGRKTEAYKPQIKAWEGKIERYM